MRFLLVALLGFGALHNVASADERFYTTVDAQGRVQVLKSDTTTVEKKQNTVKPESKSLLSAPAQAVQTTQAPAKTDASSSKKVEPNSYQLGTETYIDNSVLEKKDFDRGEKKRFYYLPDGGVGTQVVETQAGVIVAPTSTTVTKAKPISFIASAYQQLSSAELKTMYVADEPCFKPAYLKKNAKAIKETNNVWVKSSLTTDIVEPDTLLTLSTEAQQAVSRTVRLVSFATSHKRPAFYLPVIIFLDNSGCPISGVWRYWSQAQAATDKQYASVDGLITIPEHSAYLLTYRPVDTLKADIPSTNESGSFVIETY